VLDQARYSQTIKKTVTTLVGTSDGLYFGMGHFSNTRSEAVSSQRLAQLGHPTVSFSSWENIHEGRPIFVVGSGPSLRDVPDDALDGHISIVVGHAIKKFPHPTYFLATDGNAYKQESFKLLKDTDCKVLLSILSLHGDVEAISEIVPPTRQVWFLRSWDRRIHDVDSITSKLIPGTCVMHPAYHLARIMGGSPIVLLGADCAYDGDDRYFDCDGGGKKEWHQSILAYHAMEWYNIAGKTTAPTINASGGTLYAFPRMSLEKVLEQCQQSNNDKQK
jgi:hypothetical protein